MVMPILQAAATFALTLLPWHPSFNAAALAFVLSYVAAQLAFCVALRRLAMVIPGPTRMCSPLGIWALAVPGIGAMASFGLLRGVWHAATAATTAHHVAPPRATARTLAMAYGISRICVLVPGLSVPALAIQAAAAIGFLAHLYGVARTLRTPDVAVA